MRDSKMAGETEKSVWLTYMPGLLAGSAALIAALTTMYVNLRSDTEKEAARILAAQASAPAVVASVQQPAAPPSPVSLMLSLDQVRVDNDGSLGSTDWTFEVLADGRPLFVAPFKGLNDRAGAHLKKPAAPDQVTGRVLLPLGKSSEIVVNGWKQGWIRSDKAPDVSGRAWLLQNDSTLAVQTKSDVAGGAAFVIHFTAAAEGGR
jgi:hypothetical protein